MADSKEKAVKNSKEKLSFIRQVASDVRAKRTVRLVDLTWDFENEKAISIRALALQEDDCADIGVFAEVVSSHVEVFSLFGCLAPRGFREISGALAKCTRLVQLIVVSPVLQPLDADHFLEAILNNRNSLKRLDLRLLPFDSQQLSSLLIHSCTGLTNLYLGGHASSDTRANVDALFKIFRQCRHLAHLELRHFVIGDRGLHRLRSMLVALPLVELRLHGVGMTDQSAVTLQWMVPQLGETLRVLDLGKNTLSLEFAGGCARMLQSATRTLQALVLARAGLGLDSLPLIGEAMMTYPKLAELRLVDLSGNTDLCPVPGEEEDSRCEKFLRQLKYYSRVNTLILPGTEADWKGLYMFLYKPSWTRNRPNIRIMFNPIISCSVCRPRGKTESTAS